MATEGAGPHTVAAAGLVNALDNERSCSISRRAGRAELLLVAEEAEAGDEGLGGGRRDGKQGWLDPGERAAGRTGLDGLEGAGGAAWDLAVNAAGAASSVCSRQKEAVRLGAALGLRHEDDGSDAYGAPVIQ